MKKQLLSWILIFGMLAGMLPGTAFAVESEQAPLDTVSFDTEQKSHACAAEPTKVATFSELKNALNAAGDADILLDVSSDTVWSVTSTLSVTSGTKHIMVPERVTVTLKRGTNSSVLFDVASGARLIMGDGVIRYSDNTLEEAAKAGNYEVTSAGGGLVIDGGAVWTRGDEYTGNNFRGDSSGKNAVLYDQDGKQYFFTNNGSATGYSLIKNAGRLDIWGGITLQNNAKTNNFGSAINSTSGSALTMYGGIVTMCVTAGTGDQGQGAIYVGNSGVNWTTKPTNPITSFIMYSGKVTRNAASGNGVVDGGGVALDHAQMYLYDGEISYNHGGVEFSSGAGDGGGIMVRCGSVLDMYGGSVDHNYAGGYGGGVVAWNGDINVHGGSISDNKGGFGGGIGIAASYERDGSTATSVVTMTGGTVARNEAIVSGIGSGYGGGICAGSGNFKKGAHLNLSGGTILQNRAEIGGGGIAVYAEGNGDAATHDANTAVVLSGNFKLTNNAALSFGNGMYITNTSTSNLHTLVDISGAAQIDTNNPVYFENVGQKSSNKQIPVLVSGTLTSPGVAAIFEFSNDFWARNDLTGLDVVKFADELDIQENRIALDNSSWYLKTNTTTNTLELQKLTDNPQYTIRNGTPVVQDGKKYYKLYASLADAFKDAADGDTLYIFYNTTVSTSAVVDGKNLTLLAESTSTAGLDAALASGSGYGLNEASGYYVMSGPFLLYNSGVPASTTSYNYNVRNDYTITLSGALSLGETTKNGYKAKPAAVIVNGNASLDIGQEDAAGMGMGALTFDGNLSYPKEGSMFQVGGSLTLHSGITIKNHSNYSEAHPGAIEVLASGQLTMNDGVTIAGNVSPIAGAVYNQGIFRMNGGTIESNSGAMPRYGFIDNSGSKYDGYDTAYLGQPKYYYGAGAVYNEGKFTLNSGTIKGNRGEYGAVAQMAGTLSLNDGSIAGNHAHTGSGGNSTLCSDCTLAVQGYTEGVKPDNSDSGRPEAIHAGSGGGLYIGSGSSKVTIGDVTISANMAEMAGGGIAAGPSTTMGRTISGYTQVNGASENIVSGTVDAFVPNYAPVSSGEGATSYLNIQLQGTTVTSNSAGGMGGGIYLSADGSLTLDENVTLSGNRANQGGGLAAYNPSTGTTSVTFRNIIQTNTAQEGGGIYVGANSTITAYGQLLDNTAEEKGGGACLAAEGSLILDGARVNNNKLSGTGAVGVGIYNDGSLTLTADGGTQPYLSYNDHVYLAQDRVLTLDQSYDIKIKQSGNDALTLNSAVTELGTDMIRAASTEQATAVLDSGYAVHRDGIPLSPAGIDSTVLELNYIPVIYHNGLSDGTGSTYNETPGGSHTILGFEEAGKGSWSLPTGRVLDRWVVIRQDGTVWKYVRQDGTLDVNYDSSAQYQSYYPGNSVSLSETLHLAAIFSDAQYTMIIRDTVNNGNVLQNGSMTTGNVTTTDAGILYVGNDKTITLSPMPDRGQNTDEYRLNSLMLYTAIDREAYNAGQPNSPDHYVRTGPTGNYSYWKLRVLAEVDNHTGLITGTKNYDSNNALITGGAGVKGTALPADNGRTLSYHTTANNILVLADFAEGEVRLDTYTKLEDGVAKTFDDPVYTAWYSYDELSLAITEMTKQYDAMGNNTLESADVRFKAELIMVGDSAPTFDDALVLSLPYLDLTLDQNGKIVTLTGTTTRTVSNGTALTLRNGTLTNTDVTGLPLFQVDGSSSLTAEKLTILAPDASHTVSLETIASTLRVDQASRLGKVHLAGDFENHAGIIVIGDFTENTGTELVATLCLDGTAKEQTAKSRVLTLPANTTASAGHAIRSWFSLDEAISPVWFITTAGQLAKRVRYVVPEERETTANMDHSLLTTTFKYTDSQPQTVTSNGQTLNIYYENVHQYGHDGNKLDMQVVAHLLDMNGQEVIADGTMVVSLRLVNKTAGNGGTSTAGSGTPVVIHAGRSTSSTEPVTIESGPVAATLAANTFDEGCDYTADGDLFDKAKTVYYITASWTGSGEYDTRYADYWLAHGERLANDGSLSGLARLLVTPKPLEDESVAINGLTPNSAGYIGPEGAAANGSSAPYSGFLRDTNTGLSLTSGREVNVLFRAVTTEDTGNYAGEAGGVLYYYKDDIYYSSRGSADNPGTRTSPKDLDGAAVGTYAAELAPGPNSNYYNKDGASTWKGEKALFTITPYTGYLSLFNGDGHIVAQKPSDYASDEVRDQIRAVFKNPNLRIQDSYGNPIAASAMAYTFQAADTNASVSADGWPASEGLYAVQLHPQGADKQAGVEMFGHEATYDPNYSSTAYGYHALLITDNKLEMVIEVKENDVWSENGLVVPFLDEIYTEDSVKAYDKGEDDADDKLRVIKRDIAGTYGERLTRTEYVMQVGLAQDPAWNVGSYLLLATDNSGRYVAVGALDIQSGVITDVIVEPAQAIYTAQPISPQVTVKSQESVLALNRDYSLVSRMDGSLAQVRDAGTYDYYAVGKGNFTGETTAQFVVQPKDIANGDGTAAQVTLTRTYTSLAWVPMTISLRYNGTQLIRDTDYTVSVTMADGSEVKYDGTAENRPLPGIYKYTITGKGNYTGTISDLLYTIYEPITEHNALTITTAPESFVYQATEFAAYNWTSSATATLSITSREVVQLDLTRCSVQVGTMQADGAGQTFVPNDNKLDVGSYIVRVAPNSDYAAELKQNYILADGVDLNGYINLLITPKPVTITVEPGLSKTFGTSDPGTFTYTTDLNDNNPATASVDANGFYKLDSASVKGALSRAEGEDVTSAGYRYALGSFTAGDNYALSVSTATTFMITAKSVADNNVVKNVKAEVAYTGYPVRPVVSVSYNGRTLHGNSDYVLLYFSVGDDGTTTPISGAPSDAGRYRVTISGEACTVPPFNYSGESTHDFQVVRSTSGFNVTLPDGDTKTYTGQAYTPTVLVQTLGSTLISSNYALTYTYQNAAGQPVGGTEEFRSGSTELTRAGTYTITASGRGNYTGSNGTVTFRILPKDLAEDDNLGAGAVSAAVTGNNPVYDGSAQTPAIDAAYNGSDLTAGTDYTLAYSNNINAGEATVTLYGKGNFTGSRSLTFMIDRRIIHVEVTGAEKTYGSPEPVLTYTAFADAEKAQKLENVKFLGALMRESGEDVGDYALALEHSSLTAGVNYDLQLIGEPKLVITRKIIGTQDGKPAGGMAASIPHYVAHDTETVRTLKAKITLTHWAASNERTLEPGTDYTIQILDADSREMGDQEALADGITYTVQLIGKGNYSNTIEQQVAVVNADSMLQMTGDSLTYTGAAQSVTLAPVDKDGKGLGSYTFNMTGTTRAGHTVTRTHDGDSWTLSVTEAGTYTVTATITVDEKVYYGMATITVSPRNIDDSDVSASVQKEYPYNDGNPVNLPAGILTFNGLTLNSPQDYLVTYTDNTMPDQTVTATITGLGNYTGTRTVSYQIGQMTYLVQYAANGGSGAPGDTRTQGRVNVQSGTGVTHTPESGKDVLFVAWSTETVSHILATGDPLPAQVYYGGQSFDTTKNVIFHAVWGYDENENGIPDVIEGSVNVLYDAGTADGVSGTAPTDSGKYLPGSTATVQTNVGGLDRAGYVLMGWSTKAPSTNGHTAATMNDYLALGTVYTQGSQFVLGNTSPFRLYAVWGTDADNDGTADWLAGSKILVIYDGNGGTNSPAPGTAVSNTSITLSSVIPLRLNAVFLGWTVEQNTAPLTAEYSGTLYPAGGSYPMGAITEGEYITLYALWAEDVNGNGSADYAEHRYSVRYENAADDVTSSNLPVDSDFYLAGVNITLGTAPSGTYSGDVKSALFLGWTSDSSAAAKLYTRDDQLAEGTQCFAPGTVVTAPATIPSSDGEAVTYYPLWAEENYNAQTYSVIVTAATGGSAAADKTSVLAGGTAVITITPKAGYVLDKVYVNGTDLTDRVSGGKLTLSGIAEKQLVSVSFQSSAFVVEKPASVTYNGSGQPPLLTVKNGGEALTEGTHYTVIYADRNGTVVTEPKDADTYAVTIIGAAGTGYAGNQVTVYYTIQPAKITEAAASGTFTYDGTAKIPTVTVTAVPAPTASDYTLSYSDNVNAGTGTVTVTGQGNYTGTVTATFEIGAAALTLAEIPAVSYTGKTQNAALTVTGVGGKELTPGTDYQVSGASGTNAGSYTVTVTGMGNYAGSTDSENFVIRKYGVESGENLLLALGKAAFGQGGVDLTGLTVKDWNGNALSEADYDLTVKNSAGDTVDDLNNAPTGVYTVHVEAASTNYDPTYAKGELQFVITAQPLTVTNSVVKTYKAATYTAEDLKDDITVTVGGTALTYGTNYTLTVPTMAQDAGPYTILIEGVGSYAGYSGATTLVIRPAALTSISVETAGSYTGSAITPNVTVSSAVGTPDAGDYELTWQNNVQAGTATVIAAGKGNYTGSVSTTFTIQKAVLTVTPNIASKTYGSADPTFTYTSNGVTLDGALDREPGESVGQYSYTLGTLRDVNGNYELRLAEQKFLITPKSIEDSDVAKTPAAGTTQTKGYSGGAVAADVHLLWNDRLLVDYTVEYRSGSSEAWSETAPSTVGIYEVRVTGKGNYTGSYTFGLEISASVLSVSAENTEVIYNGAPQMPGALSVKFGDTDITNYTVSYRDEGGSPVTEMINAGVYTGIVKATGYEDVDFDFTILPKPLEDSMVTVTGSASYNGSQQIPSVSVSDGTALTATDYTVAYGANVAAGTGSVTVRGQRNYTGDVTKTFSISAVSLSVGELTDVTYDGQVHQLRPTVTFGGTTAIENVDYTLSWSASDFVKTQGNIVVTVTGIGNFNGESRRAYSITAKTLDAGMIAAIGDQTYTGSAIEPSPFVTYSTPSGLVLLLSEGTDYTVTYANNTAIGTATMTVIGKGNYTGSAEKNFNIVSDSDGLVVGMVSDRVYDGSAYLPSPAVTFNGVTTVLDTDYTLSYAAQSGSALTNGDPVNVGSYTVTVTGLNSFDGFVRTMNFSITAKTLEATMVSGLQSAYAHTGSAIQPVPTVKDGDNILVKDTDYSVNYGVNTAAGAGTGTLTITGIGNYTGTVTHTFDITTNAVIVKPGAYSKVYGEEDPSFSYTTEPETVLSGTLKRESGENVGEYDYDISGLSAEGAALTLDESVKFTINAKTVGDGTQTPAAQITVIGSFELGYTGAAAVTSLSIIYDAQLGKRALLAGTDYDVAYKAAGAENSSYTDKAPVEVGNYIIRITGKGNYGGAILQPLEIKAVSGALAVTTADISVVYDGNAHEPTLTVKDGNTTLTDNDYEVSYAKGGTVVAEMVDADVYTIIVTGKGNYVDKTGTVTFIIRARSLNDEQITAAVNGSFMFNNAEQTPALTLTDTSVPDARQTLVMNKDYTAVYAANRNVGTATVTLTGIGNYCASRSLTFTIAAAELTDANVTAPADVIYNGAAQAEKPVVSVIHDGTAYTLNEGTDYTLSYSGHVNAGPVAVTITGRGNYTGTISASYQILPQSLADQTRVFVAAIADQSYTGSAIAPVPALTCTTDGRTLTLKEDTDFTVHYTDANGAVLSDSPVQTGEYWVILTAVDGGNYSGNRSQTFRIVSAGQRSLTVNSEPISTTYTGSAQQPTITVKDGEITLSPDTDYRVSYTGEVNGDGMPEKAGIYTVNVFGAGNYDGFAGTATFIITPAALSEITVSGTCIYDGDPQQPAVTVISDVGSPDIGDYDLVWRNNTNAGTATVIAVGTGNYAGSVSTTFAIRKARLTVTPEADSKTYGEYDPDFEYDSGDVTLTGALGRQPGEHVGSYAYTLGSLRDTSGNYELDLAQTHFTIAAKDIGELDPPADLTIGCTGAAYNGPVIMTHDADLGLRQLTGQDYELSFISGGTLVAEARLPGTYTVTVTGRGNYTGDTTFELTIDSARLGLTLPVSERVFDGMDHGDRLDPMVTSPSGDILTQGEHYYIEHASELIDADVYTIVAIGNDIYELSSDTAVYLILEKDVDDRDVRVTKIDAQTYTGSAITPELTVTYAPVGGKALTLREGVDYDAIYAANRDVGTATITIIGKGNYTGSTSTSFQIIPANLWVEQPSDVEFSPMLQAVRPVVRGVEDRVLTENVDYTLSYSGDSSNVGEVIITVTGIGNYATSSENTTYTITPRTIQSSWITVTPAQLTYTGSSQKPATMVVDNGIILVEGKDYVLTWPDDTTGVGTVTYTVTGTGNYTGTATASYTISAAGDLMVGAVTNAVYSGAAYLPVPSVTFNESTLTAGTDYRLSYAAQAGSALTGGQPVNVGNYTVTVTGMDSFDGFVRTMNFAITPKTLTAAMVSGFMDSLPYTGRPVTQSGLNLADGDLILTVDVDFRVGYENNSELGTAKLILTGMGNYTGRVEMTFSINSSTLHYVTYNGNGHSGGVVPEDTRAYLGGCSATVLRGVPTRDRAVFLGWVPETAPTDILTSRDEENAYTICYQAGDTFVVTADVLLYALWAQDVNENGRPDYKERPVIRAYAEEGGTITPEGRTVYSWGERDVTYHIEADRGYSFLGLVVDDNEVEISTTAAPTALTENRDGSYTYTFARVTENHTIIVYFRQRDNNSGGGSGGGGNSDPVVIEPVRPMPQSRPGVPQLRRDTNFAYVNGIDGLFCPEAMITRAEVAVMLARLMCGGLEVPRIYESRFIDVPTDAWYYEGVAYLEYFDIVQVGIDSRYEPNRPITRAEFIAMVMRFFRMEEYSWGPAFSDLDEQHWAYRYIEMANHYGFLTGYTDGTCGPDRSIRRAEAVAIINRVIGREISPTYVATHWHQLVTFPDILPTYWAYYQILAAANTYPS